MHTPATRTTMGAASSHPPESPSSQSTEKASITLDQLTAEFAKQRAWLKEDVSSIIQESIEPLQATLCTLQTTVNFLQKRLTSVEFKAGENLEQLVESTIKTVQNHNQLLVDRLDDFENRPHRTNLRILNIPEGGEDGKDPLKFMEEALMQIMGPDVFPAPPELERAHRTLTARSAQRKCPCTFIVGFSKFQQKEAALRWARSHELKYNGAALRVYQDFSAALAKKRASFNSVKQALYQKNVRFQHLYPARLRVVYKGNVFNFDSPEVAQQFYNHMFDSSQNDSLSDQEDHRPGFSMPSISASSSFDAQDNDASSQNSSKFSMYNSVSQKLMAKMGFREGEGLGKFGQGRKEIVETSTQRGRRGLGLTLQGFQGELNVDWEDEPEPSAVEKVDWFPECTTEIPDADELKDWMILGDRKLRIEDETEFCSEDLLHTLLRCKTVFDDLEGEEMRRARTRSNPYETIRGGIFLNRAAMKMANMDHCFDNMFTNPKDSQGKSLTKDREGELLYFGDVCAGPGGFSEYILWKRHWHAKGFGMTLKGPCDFKLEDFYAAPSELFEPYYGEGGVDGDGDITRPENITAFRNFVMESTDRKGLHVLMADGGFSVEGQENIQEILSKQLLLCQFLTALSTLRTGGHFVCKTFDLFTPFSVGLVYLLYLGFDRISLFKPVTSRPANSERYIVCRGLKPGSDAVREYMFRVNLKLNHLKNSGKDVTDVVPLSIIKEDADFFQFMVNSNESLSAVQIKALAKIHAYVVDPTLSEPRQADIRKECLKLWGVPDKARVAPSSSDPKAKFCELIKNSDVESFQCKLTPLNSSTLDKLRHILDHRCIVGCGEQIFLLALGKSQIYTWDGKMPLRWRKMENFKLELPRDTLLSVEIVQELKGEGKAQRRINAVHVMDALILNGTDVRDQHFNQRIQMAEKFVKAVAKPSRTDMNPIRVKEVYRLEEMEKIFLRLEMKVTKSSGGVPRLSYTGRDDRHFLPKGLYIIKTVNEPWTMAYSKNSKMKFFYNKITKKSTYAMPPNSAAPFHVCHSERLFWAWEDGVIVHDSQTRMDPEKLSKDEFLTFIHRNYQL